MQQQNKLLIFLRISNKSVKYKNTAVNNILEYLLICKIISFPKLYQQDNKIDTVEGVHYIYLCIVLFPGYAPNSRHVIKYSRYTALSSGNI